MARQKRVKVTKVTAETGNGWKIVRDLLTNDFEMHITRDERGYIGSAPTVIAARERLTDTLLAAAQH
jgi:hypothetical protein